jgi:uncharacterized DUF497 family protein
VINFNWNEEKNGKLKRERNVSFENVVYAIEHNGLLDTIDNPNETKYSHQRVFIVRISDYVYIVPFVENETEIFLKTIIPNRKMTKMYLQKD